MYCGPVIEGRLQVSTGPRWEGLCVAPISRYLALYRNRVTSVLWLSSCSKNLKGGSKLKNFCLFASPCDVSWGEIIQFFKITCAVSKWDFTPGKGKRWLLVKCFKCLKDCLKILLWYISFETHKGKKREREKATSLQGWISKGNTLFCNRFIKLYNRWQIKCSF